jgi:hypothetical protein
MGRAAHHGVTVTVFDMLAVPPRFETTRTIVYVPWLLYVWDGFCSVETDDDPAPSPKFHDQASVQPGVVVEKSVKSNCVCFFLPLEGENTKLATGG